MRSRTDRRDDTRHAACTTLGGKTGVSPDGSGARTAESVLIATSAAKQRRPRALFPNRTGMPSDLTSPPPEPSSDPVEILARFARSAGRDAPQGTLIVDGREPLRFAGWLDLMAIVEQILEDERLTDSAANEANDHAEPPPEDIP